MRGRELLEGGMFTYIPLEKRIPEDHPLRPIRAMVEEALKELSPRLARLYPKRGRPSIPPERLLRALLLQALYTIRSERQLMEQLDYNLLYRWFVGLDMEDPVWDPTVFTKNRERLLQGDIARAFFQAVVAQAEAAGLLSADHFTVDGTLIEAWASQKSFVPREGPDPRDGDDDPGNPTVDFRGQKRSNRTHVSTTDPDARLTKRKGQTSQLAYHGHVLTENRHGLVVDAEVTRATGRAEWEAALEMAERIPGRHRVTLAGDKGYDYRGLVESLRRLEITPHVVQNTARNWRTALDRRTTRHRGYAQSQRRRKRVEEVFGWMKTVGGLRKTRHRGLPRVTWSFLLTATAYNLVRMRNLMAAT
jgi:transposase